MFNYQYNVFEFRAHSIFVHERKEYCVLKLCLIKCMTARDGLEMRGL